MATKQDTYGDATLLAAQAGSEVEGGLLIGTNIDEGVCLDFVPGSSQYVNVGNAGSTVRSITLWINPDDITTTGLLELSGGNRIDIGSSVISTTGLTGPIIYVNGVVTTTIVANVWQHIAVTFTANETASAVTLALSNSAYYDGRMDDVRFFTSELTAAQIRQVYATGDNPETPVNWWKFNEGTGTNAADSGSGGDAGTLTNGPTWTTTHIPFYAVRSRATSTDLLTGLGSTTVNSFLSTIGKHPGGGSGKLQFSSDNATWKNANGDLVDNAGGQLFDGVNDTGIYTVAGFRSSDSAGGLVALIRLDALGAIRTIASSADTASTTRFWTFEITAANKLAIRQNENGTATTITGSTTFVANRLYQVAVTSSGTAYSLYVDGVAETLTVTAGSNNGDWFADTPDRDNFCIGVLKTTSETNFFSGLIDSIRLYSTEPTADQLWTLFSRHKDDNSANRVGWWKLETDGTDSSGNGYTITLSGTTTVAGWWELPQFGEPIADDFDVLSFDGVNDRVVTGLTGTDTGGPSVASAYTLTAWVRPNSNGTLDCACGWGASSDALAISSGLTVASAVLFYAGDNGVDYGTTRNGLLVAGQWTHLALVYDGSQSTNATRLVGYVNGIAEPLTFHSSATIDATLPSLTTDLSIGDWGTTGRYWTGLIANVAAYNAALSAATILADFQNGYPSSTSRVAYWPLNEGSGTNAEETDGNLDGTISGATWVKDIARPQPTTPVQQTLSLSLLGFTSAVYYRALYSEIVADRAMALAEVTVDYTAGGLKRHPRMNARMAEMSGGLV